MDTFQYIKTLASFRDGLPNKPSWVRITTITLYAKQILGDVDPKKIRRRFKAIGGSLKLRPVGSDKSFEWKIKASKRAQQFYNCISISYTDCYSTKAVKLFSNGSIQIAGCSNVLDCKRVVKQLAIVLPIILNRSLDIRYDQFKIVMINTNFTVNQQLNLYKVIKDFKDDKYEVKYDPGSYAPVVVKFKPLEHMKRITVCIFSTGSVGITGAETLMEVAHAYKEVNEMIGNESRVQDLEYQQDFNMIMGAPFEEWLRVLNVVK
jgi:TATA-box binding protein (TBP) (component of TFIID and TFIIIB)